MKYLEIIADNLSKAGWSWGCVPAVDSEGRTIWIVDAHGDGKRFVVRADEKLTAFMELESVVPGCWRLCLTSSCIFQNSPAMNPLKSCCLLTIVDVIVAAPKRLRRNDAYREQSAGGRSQSATRCTDSWWTADRVCACDSRACWHWALENGNSQCSL